MGFLDGMDLAAAPYIIVWLCLSAGLIFMNQSILLRVPTPCTLTAWHMGVSTVLVRLLRMSLPSSSKLFDADEPVLTAKMVVTKFLPVALSFAVSLALGNRAYIYCSVPFLQMVKASRGPMTYVLGVLVGSEAFGRTRFELTVVIAAGVIMAVTGEMRFSWIGFSCQVLADFSESLRLVLIALLLNHSGLKLTPLSTLSYFAPLCFVLLVPAAVLSEMPADIGAWWRDVGLKVGYLHLAMNGLMAFALNVAGVLLVQQTSAVGYILCGIVKDVLIVSASALLLGQEVSFQQIVGYALSLGGIQAFNWVGRGPETLRGLGIRGALKTLSSKQASGFEAVSTREVEVVGATQDKSDDEATSSPGNQARNNKGQ
eukprot:TRINITY_DN1334_c0_g1_i1.p1 TRINITY_DN1334_c0_g1~~TRINITY_DN1334_c0_g1_i1.p1  ORF type:complete len:371 (-),score=44.26 TRINITY_DN1334_c0_g1_i1:30-1142(-)